jgi:putative membrane protein insertion efficiency factor
LSLARRIATLPIRCYQRFVSPFTPAICRFSPTCSQYAVEAIERRGLVVGALLALWRLLRCHPFCKGGYDPVPERES